jgi:hypothetical protein
LRLLHLFSGPDWPDNGEIDIIEGVNSQNFDAMTLHTSSGCVITDNGVMSSTTLLNPDCNSGGASDGCSEHSGDPESYGTAFNKAGNGTGGAFAMEWTSDHIAIWFWQRSHIPGDITSDKPNPSSWGAPSGRFSASGGTGCNIAQHFTQHAITFDTTFCGDWAGNVWGSDPVCSKLAANCVDYVAQHPEAFQELYWIINSLKVYQMGGNTKQVEQPTHAPAVLIDYTPVSSNRLAYD